MRPSGSTAPITATIIKDEVGRSGVRHRGYDHYAVAQPGDFEIAERHELDKEQIIDFHGKLLPIAGEFAGMPIAEARPKIVEKLKKKGLVGQNR